ncbi:uncharacterized protein LOC105831015 [Monomorium pharaonis]|uniref:uncharacterized protein LOC105831015 n=1 Tax=Monomorium pharaonis TaxID=307658 RepID=UPI00063F32B2|nr:uncharacterized protein LOC105831015 [Monomorium pharaonis]XP_036142256.1 uncharacterized protein LOC105831015 [Monomorium pharaonis]XP_036142257.1 uncharacterized protein LOC105831015 [Monomorium pharaonis]XP_036142258.1 uncharacterized protein LOC105831015 [Monomorium pharaonis]XP_036142259.1 uncharacterized protein LOC105831015 [Monomorium pharaonis]XP_036142260.1 uncharacterized protein LOC105831015 [Monomorium pharaonis]
MEIIEGKRNGSQLYVYNNYTYCMDKRFGNIYRCSKRKKENCPAVIEREGESCNLKHKHNHSEERYIFEIHKMKREMIRLSKETTSPKSIFDTVSCNNLKVAPYISYNSMKSILSRHRASSRPNIPSDLHSLHKQLETYIPTNNIYKGCAISCDNKIALIFSTDTLLNVLSEASEIFVDGTFSIVPKKPSIAQLYTIHIRYIDTGIATVFVLCEARSASLYKAMWEKIVSLAPGLNKNLKFIMADYEQAAIKAMNEQFPTVTIHGCWFHYSQALVRKWRQLGLDDEPSELLSMAKTMALAPSNLFEKSLNIMQIFSNNLTKKYPAIDNFLQYIKNMWLPIAPKVSVFGCPNRTNNLVENFYGNITKKLGATPNLWKFLDDVNNLIVNQMLNYERLQLGHSLKQSRMKLDFYKNRRIGQAQINLVTGRISLQQFLQIFVRVECQEKISEDCEENNYTYDDTPDNGHISIENIPIKDVRVQLLRIDTFKNRIPLSDKTNIGMSSTSSPTKKTALRRSTYKNKSQ